MERELNRKKKVLQYLKQIQRTSENHNIPPVDESWDLEDLERMLRIECVRQNSLGLALSVVQFMEATKSALET